MHMYTHMNTYAKSNLAVQKMRDVWRKYEEYSYRKYLFEFNVPA